MFLNSNTTACILKKLEPLLPYPINIMNYEGMVVNSSVPQNIGEFNVAASNYIKPLHSGGQLPVENFDGIKSMCGITVRQRIVGAIELENLRPSDSAYLSLSKTIAELMLEQECMFEGNAENTTSIDDLLSILVGVHPLDPSQKMEYNLALRDNGISCKMIFDCTVPYAQKKRFERSKFLEVDYRKWCPDL